MVRKSSGRLFHYLGAATMKATSAYIHDIKAQQVFVFDSVIMFSVVFNAFVEECFQKKLIFKIVDKYTTNLRLSGNLIS